MSVRKKNNWAILCLIMICYVVSSSFCGENLHPEDEYLITMRNETNSNIVVEAVLWKDGRYINGESQLRDNYASMTKYIPKNESDIGCLIIDPKSNFSNCGILFIYFQDDEWNNTTDDKKKVLSRSVYGEWTSNYIYYGLSDLKKNNWTVVFKEENK